MRIPKNGDWIDLQLTLRDIQTQLELLTTRDVDLHGRRIVNAGLSRDSRDYVTKEELSSPVTINSITKNLPASPSIYALVYRNGALSLADNTSTAIGFDAESEDLEVLHDNSTNNTRITISTTGLYIVHGQICFSANNAWTRGADIKKNGTSVAQRTMTTAASGAAYLQVTWLGKLVSTDYVELFGYQNSGGSLALTTGVANTFFSIGRIK